MEKPLLYFSNSLEKLASLLCSNLFLSPSSFLEKKVVLIPQKHWENELIRHFLTKEELPIGAGVEFSLLGSGVHMLLKKMSTCSLSFPSEELLALHLYHLLEERLERKEEKGRDLLYYLEGEKEVLLLQKRRKKILSLSKQLSFIFLEYGTFGGEALKKWQKEGGWQASLFTELSLHWNFPVQILEQKLFAPFSPFELHIFGFPFLPKLYHYFFAKVAEHLKVFYYQLSPCTTFWSDLSTSKERFFIDHRLEESKVSKQTREELQLYLKRGHPLLANFGKLEKENIKVFEEEGFPTEEHYLPPSPTTLLKKVQRDLFVDREEGEKEQLPKDPSLILFPASSKLREIEILYLTIRELLSDQSLLPSDIKIYAPDMEKYAPYIQLIFGAKHSPFAFHIRGTEILGKSPLLIAFFQLLSLREKRFSISAVFTLLFTPSFRKKFQLEEKDLFLFQKWMEKCGVKWGMDGKQKAHFLSAKEREELAQGSFEAAFERLLSSLGFLPEERGYFPSPILDISEGELLAKCIHLLRLLKEDSDFLENSFLSLEEWSLYLRSLVDRYFFPLEEERSFYLFLTEKIGNLPFLGSLTAGKKFPFSPIHQFLLSGMQEKGGSDFHHNLQSLSFSSLHLGGISEAKVICLIGMGEGEFPRSPFTSSLQELKKWKGADFSPSKIEEDRSLLLSTLLLAKERLIISYIHFDEKDGKETLPSLLVQELMSSLNRFYEIDGKKVSEAILRKHPPFSFHNSYFEKDSFLKNSSAEEYEKGAAFYLHPKPPYQPFIPEYTSIQSIEKEVQKEFLLNTKELFSFAKHPLRHYFNKELKIFYDFYQREEEEFLLSPLSRSLFKNGLLYDPFEKILAETIREGKLPFSPFKEVSIKELQKEAKELLSDLERHQIKREDLLTIELKAGCEKREEIRKNYWMLPPLLCPLSPKCHAIIEGKLPPITSKGLLIQGEKELSELVKIYPLYLVFSALKLNFGENALLFTKEKEGITLVKENKEEVLQNYLLYYHASQSIPSPFLPSWAQVFLNKEASELQKKIDQALSLQQERIDPYLHAVFARKESFSAEAIHATWSPLLKKVFGALL